MKVAIIYHSAEGHTREIAERIASVQEKAGRSPEVIAISEAPDCLLGYGAVVVGGSIHYGHHHKDLESYAAKHAGDLSTVTSAFFSVSLTAAEDAEEPRAEVNRYLNDFFEATRWQPDVVGVFGGALLYTRYGFLKRKMMQLIAKQRGGPTDTKRDYDLTDWDAVDQFAEDVAKLTEVRGEAKPAWD